MNTAVLGGSGEAAPTDYRIVEEADLKVFYGPLAMSELGTALKACPPGWVMDTIAAGLVGAVLVVGLPEAIERFKVRAVPGLGRRTEVKAALDSGLSVAAVQWLLAGDRGASSEALFAACTGFSKVLRSDRTASPFDGADFDRCAVLQEKVPECANVAVAASLSPVWAAIIERWDALLKARRRDIRTKTQWRATTVLVRGIRASLAG